MNVGRLGWVVGILIVGGITLSAPTLLRAQQDQFHVEEASITDIQNAIKSGKTTCEQVVRAYLARAKAYNGACTALPARLSSPRMARRFHPRAA